MKKLLKQWFLVLTDPSRGFGDLDEHLRVSGPLILILLLLTLGTGLSLPVLNSDAYRKAVVRMQSQVMMEKGQSMTDADREALSEQLESPFMKALTPVSAVIGGLVSFVVIYLAVALLVKGLLRLMKYKIPFRMIFLLLLFSSAVGLFQSLIKNSILITGPWASELASVVTSSDLRQFFITPLSAAALLERETVSPVVYVTVDFFTDIFNWLFFLLIFAGLRNYIKINKKSAWLVTVFLVVVFFIIGAVPQLM